MAAPHEKLAASLAELEKLQKGGRRAFRSNELTRSHRERLLKQGFLREVIKGWLISSSLNAEPGDSTPWYASFWQFCASYCEDRFGDQWHLSPEQSLLLHAENTVIPPQVVVYSPKGANNTVELLFGTSFYDLKQKQMPSADDVTVRDGLRIFTAEAALIRVPEAFFTRNPLEAQIVLGGLRNVSDLLGRLLDGGHSAVAGRLAGAFRRIGRADVADKILSALKAAGYDVRETDPFARRTSIVSVGQTIAPITARLRALWGSSRQAVIKLFPEAPGLPRNREAYLRLIDEIYRSDAYHSLSIEGYQVTPELIERVGTGAWNPDGDDGDHDNRNVLAARGYWQAFQLVKSSVAKIIGRQKPGPVVRAAQGEWYRELFQPSVAAGLIPASALAGYRNHAVFVRGSRYVPPRWEAVRDAMPTMFDLIEAEENRGVRAVLGHWLFGYIHPYPDGNGRMARFLMNAMLASGGYPWTVIRVEDQRKYLASLDTASINNDIRPFARFIAERVQWSLDQAA
ncbi:MAG: Fic family protein [Methyloceanibacter sp.]